MLIAVIAGVATLVALILIVVFAITKHRSKDSDRVTPSHAINSIDTYGVAPSKQKSGFGSAPAQQVPHSHTASGAPSEMLRSRFVAMGVLAAAVFGSLGVKLWSMQIMQASSYSQKAKENLYTTVYTPAPRGIIYDYGGVPLVKNKSSYTILATSDVADNRDVVTRLSALLGIPFEVVRQRILDATTGAQNTRVVASDASLRNIAFISEHADAFPGVTCENRTMRQYPYGALAAHVLGYTGTVSTDELSNAGEGRTVQSGDIVGKSGVEATYEDVLAGDHGTRTLLTDADGTVQQIVSETDPTRGNDIYLTIKGPVQKVSDQIMRDTVAPDGKLGAGAGSAAALVCLDATNGEVVAMSNFPTYAPESFIGGISQDIWDAFNTDSSHYPLMNRAIAGTYPAASTFKAFTSMAALQNGIATSGTTYDCTGTWTGFGDAYPQKCWKTTGHGILDLEGGIANSCDVVFYEIAKGFYEAQDKLGIDAMQNYIAEYGFGKQTGIDLSGEAVGRIPTPEWKAEYYKDAPEQAVWQGGDMSNMAIGQGYVLVTPLQIACGYAGIATGQIYKPHILKEVRNSLGATVVKTDSSVAYKPDQTKANIDLVHTGLLDVMTLNGYDSFFSDVDYQVAGKTGTAEVSGKNDYSWFACYAPADNPKYVCACIAEEGVSSLKSTIPMASAVLKAAMAYDKGTLDMTMASISGAYETVAYSVASTSRTD
jgi:penicillin-binding protein 2